MSTYVEPIHVYTYKKGSREADAEWLAALWAWKRYRPECLSNLGDIQRASSNPAPCPGCIPLRALVARTPNQEQTREAL